MMDWTDRHCRYFHRLLSPSCLLYTEMVTTGAIIHGDRDYLLGFHPAEHPLVLQLGGSDPTELATCAAIARDRGFDAVNLNVGCPSDRVQKGRFGACLMLEPGLVAECVAAMRDAVDIPVTVKTRLGVDDCDSFDYFSDFVSTVAATGCDVFVIHARKAWLSGLSPRENREVPALRYEWVYRLKRENPEWVVVLNGGVTTVTEVEQHLEHVDGVMLGRAAYQNPWLLRACELRLSGNPEHLDRFETVERMAEYVRGQRSKGVPLKHISRHLLGLFQGLPGARFWRRHIAENAHLESASEKTLFDALEPVRNLLEGRSHAA